ncbi:MAG: hypothetical protein Q8L14_14345 [Myxococcales bacterium]|nr:hypothetical protein [Myxococcales bacterium]
MSNGALFGIAAVVIYGVVLAFIIRAGIRWSRRTAQTRANVLKAGIETAGGKALVERPVTKLYEVTESEYELDGQRLFVSSTFVSRSWIRLNLRVPAGALPSCVVFPEGGVQKFGKVLGLNREVQTGDQAFDDAAYIDCHDSAEQVAKLLSVPAVRQETKTLLSLGYQVEFSKRGVEAFQFVTTLQKINAESVPQAAAALGRLAHHVPSFQPEALAPTGHALPTINIVIFSGLILAIPVGVGLASTLSQLVPPMAGPLVFLGVGGAVWVLASIGFALASRGTSYAFPRVAWFVGLGFISLPLLTGALVMAANEKLDGSAGTVRSTTITRIGHSRDLHRLYLPALVDGARQSSVDTSCKVLSALKVGDPVTVRVHDGALGIQWVELVPSS